MAKEKREEEGKKQKKKREKVMNLYDGGVIVLYASWRMGNALDAKLGVFIVSLAFYSVRFDLMVVEFRFSFLATTLLCFTRLDCFYFFLLHTALSSLIILPWKSGNGNLMWVFLGRAFGENSWVVEQKHKREWEIHKKLRFVARFRLIS